MRILSLTSRLPCPPYRGDRVRTYNFLRALSEGHDVDLVSFVRDDREAELARGLRWLDRVETVLLRPPRSLGNMALRALSPVPYQALYYRSSAMAAAVDRALREGRYDFVYVHLFRMAPFVEASLGSPSGTRPASVVDLTDAVARELELSVPHRPLPLRPAYRWEASKIRRYERRVLGLFDEAWVISKADADETRRHAPDARLAVVPNGVDEKLFAVDPGDCSPGVLFVGNLSIPHNIDALEHLARDVMPLVRRSVPEAPLTVAGRDAGARVRRLVEETGARLAGFVPALPDVYRLGTVFAAPLRFAAGVQNKILEAMAAGLPVVTSSLGNRGLSAADGSELLVRDDPAAFAAAVADVLRDDRRGREIGARGREFVRAGFRWSLARERAERLVSERRSGSARAPRP